MIEVFSGLLTPLIAVLAVYIAWQQWRTNHLRLKRELFDRRYALYEKIASFIAEILTTGKVPPDFENRRRETKAGIFLLDKKTQDFTEEVFSKAATLRSLEAMPEHSKQQEIKAWLSSQLESCPARFSRSLSFKEGQTMNDGQKRLLCGFTIFACIILASLTGILAFAIFQGIVSTQGDVFDNIEFQDHLRWIIPLLAILIGLLFTGIVAFVGFWFALRKPVSD